MDLEWLLPEQIEQILKLCELSNLEDLTTAANILETNSWNLEVAIYLFKNALHQIIEQNDTQKHKDLNKEIEKTSKAILKNYRQQGFKNLYEEDHDSEMYDVDEGFYPDVKVEGKPYQQGPTPVLT